jgi:hypothetical protein
MVLEQPQDMELAHADVALDEAPHGVAAELTDPAADFCQDGLNGRTRGLVLAGSWGVAADTLLASPSRHLKHSSDVDDLVNINYSLAVDDPMPARIGLVGRHRCGSR